MLESYLNFGVTILMMGFSWIISISWFITRFYGIQTKDSIKSKKHLALAYVIYIILGITLFRLVSREYALGVLNICMYVFLLIYWYFNTVGIGRGKKILALFFCTDFVSSMQEVNAAFLRLFNIKNPLLYRIGFLKFVFIIIFTFSMVWISWLSSRKRKEMMRFSLMVGTELITLLISFIISLFDVSVIEHEMKVFYIGISINAKNNQTVIFRNSLTIVLVLITYIAIMLVIRESEAYYFNRKNAISEYYLETQKKHYESLMESNRQIRKIKHDMKNHIYCLQSISQRGEYAELDQYLKGLSENLEKADVSIHVGSEIADAILSEKKSKAVEKGIEVKIDGDMQGVELAAMDVCTILANMMDNAIEAVEQQEDTMKIIDLSIRKNNHFLFICETNPTKHQLQIHDNRIATSKSNKENHGFGILNITETVQKYDGEVQIRSEKDEDGIYMFTIEIMIPF